MGQHRVPVGALLEVAITSKARADQDRLIAALEAIALQDSSLTFSHDAESGQIILRGTGERHLDVIVDQLRRAFRIELNMGAPQVGYRERIRRTVDIDYTHSKILGPMGQFARVVLRFEHGAAGSGFVFANEADREAVPDEYIAGIVKGLDASSANGVLAGFPFIESKATLIDGAYHEVDSSRTSFDLAASAAFRLLKDRRAVELVEPVMAVEVVTPDEFTGSVIADLGARRGQIVETDQRDDVQVLSAIVPFANMLGYENDLMSMTDRRGQFTAAFSHYEPVPRAFGDDPDRFPPAAAMRA